MFSSTVSRFDFGPLGPLEGALVGACNCEASEVAFSFALVTGWAGSGGVEFWTVIGGAVEANVLVCDKAEPRLELTAEGGGDLSRGDVGHCGIVGVVSPEATVDLELRGSFETASVTGPGWS